MSGNTVSISKEPWLGVTLSAFLAGIGQIYSGRVRRGCILICLELALFCFALWFVFSFIGDIRIGAGLFLLLGAIRIWNLFDAHKCAKRANTEGFEISRKENRDPWLAVFLSSWLPGLGQLYIKKWFLGIVFILCSIALLTIKETYLLYFFGLWAILAAFVCYHAYISSPVRREASKKLIVVIAVIILGLELLDYTAIPFKKYFVEAFQMTGRSMEPTLVEDDRFLVMKCGEYFPARGDVVVFKSPGDPNIAWAGRVVAFERESVELRDNNIYIDGKEPKCPPLQNTEYMSEGDFGIEGKPFMVPNDSLFVLGDNSSDSFDSKFYGSIPEDDLIGKAYKIYWPPARMGSIE
jgi:signal peptidase I